MSVSLHSGILLNRQMLKPFPASTFSPLQFTKWSSSSMMCLREGETPQTCRRPVPAPQGWGSAQHAAVATAPCFLMEVRNAGMSLLIPAEGDGIGRRDGEWESEKGQDFYLIHHSSCRVCLLAPQPRFTQKRSYMTVFMDCSSLSGNDREGIRERTGRN